MLELKNISKIIDERVILNNISITFPDKGFIGIKGRSGCGKSSLLYILSMIDKDFLGSLFFNGENIHDENQYIKDHISYMMQSKDYIDALTVKENIIISCCASDKEYSKTKLGEICKKLDIYELLDRFPNKLSGGQLKRMSIAKALLKDSNIIICDEPTGALFQSQAREIMQLLKEVSYERLVIIVSHDHVLLDEYCDQVLTLENGKLNGEIVDSEKNKMNKTHTIKKHSMLFYVIRQMLKQKYKYMSFVLFQWVLICIALLLLSGMNGIFQMIKESELKDVHANIISIEKKDNSAFDSLLKSYIACDYDYKLELLDFKTLSDQSVLVSCDFLPTNTDHIELISGTFPQNKNEVLVSEKLLKSLNDDKLKLLYDYAQENIKISGVVKETFFGEESIYLMQDMKKVLEKYKDVYTLVIETNNLNEDYEKLQKDYYVYSNVKERSENYHTLLLYGKVIAIVFVLMSFVISLILYSIICTLIADLRTHDICYLKTLGLDDCKLTVLSLLENIVITCVITCGGLFLYEFVFYYLNEIFHISNDYFFALKEVVLLSSKFDVYIVVFVIYMFLCILCNRKNLQYIHGLNVIDIIREE